MRKFVSHIILADAQHALCSHGLASHSCSEVHATRELLQLSYPWFWGTQLRSTEKEESGCPLLSCSRLVPLSKQCILFFGEGGGEFFCGDIQAPHVFACVRILSVRGRGGGYFPCAYVRVCDRACALVRPGLLLNRDCMCAARDKSMFKDLEKSS